MHVTLEDHWNFSGQSRRRTLQPPYRSFNLVAARSTVRPWLVALLLFFIAEDDGFWNMGKRGVFTVAAQPSPMVGDSQSR